jgi:hypothetical protein
MDVDFEPDSPTCFFSLPAPTPPERVRGADSEFSTFFPFH